MATTINAYSASLALDASQYINASKVSRKETQQLQRMVNSSRSPMDKYERALNALDNALKKGAISQSTYNRLLAEQEAKLKKATGATTQHTTAVSLSAKAAGKLQSTMIGVGKAFGLLIVGNFSVATVTGALRDLGEQMGEIDTTAKSARGMGITYNELRRLQLAAAEFAGVQGPAFNSLLGRLQRRVGEASLGMGEARTAFKMLGLDTQQLSLLSTAQQFDAVRDAISQIENPTQQAAIALKIFDSEGKQLLPLLKASSGEIGNYASMLESLGVTMDEKAVARIEKLNDLMGRNQLAWEGLKNSVLGNQGVMAGVLLVIQRIGNEIGKVNALLKVFGDLMGGQKKNESKFQQMAAERTAEFMRQQGLDPMAVSAAYAEAKNQPKDTFAKTGAAIGKEIVGTGSALFSGFQGAAQQLKDAAKFQIGVWGNQMQVQQNKEREVREAQQREALQDPLAPSAARGSQEAYKIIAQARESHEKKIEKQNEQQNKHLADMSQKTGQMLAELIKLVPMEIM